MEGKDGGGGGGRGEESEWRGPLMQASHSGEPRGRLLCGWARLVRRDEVGEGG